jgi:molybdenum cofactor cytidylyltransferase
LSQYEQGAGPPSFFDVSFLPELCKLQGAQGAKPIVSKYENQLSYCSFPLGHLDIDTPEDLKRLA